MTIRSKHGSSDFVSRRLTTHQLALKVVLEAMTISPNKQRHRRHPLSRWDLVLVGETGAHYLPISTHFGKDADLRGSCLQTPLRALKEGIKFFRETLRGVLGKTHFLELPIILLLKDVSYER
jgi:hypothetical protein